jgi:hypothetical protein
VTIGLENGLLIYHTLNFIVHLYGYQEQLLYLEHYNYLITSQQLEEREVMLV